ncbi:MAG: DUF1501 domain-containing protein [Acidimicrobiia bacterium]|nr:DUF1501 domain-containing protein [Acidimicrobiia bacterium]
MTLTPTRRTFLKGSAVAAGAAAAVGTGGVTLSTLTNATPAGAATGTGRLVVVFLRGGQDHLSTVVPYTRPSYYAARPTIAIPANAVLDLDGEWGLHPAVPRLHSLYQAGRLGVVACVGNPAHDESHFGAQDLWEYGATSLTGVSQGWIARCLNATASPSDSVFRAITAADRVDLSLRGYSALGVGSIASFGLGGVSGRTTGLEPLLSHEYGGVAPVEVTGRRALDAIDELGAVTGSNANDPVKRAFADLATLFDRDLGVEVATINTYGWDTHANMGTATTGSMRDLLAGLDSYLADFQADLDARGVADVTTVVMTEFGRRYDQNGTGGLDHGNGMAMLVMGARVNGGHVYGTWEEPVVEHGARDVAATTDFRDVLGGLSAAVLGVSPTTIFPGHSYTPVGVVS